MVQSDARITNLNYGKGVLTYQKHLSLNNSIAIEFYL